MDGAIGLGIGLDGPQPQREGVIALGKFERDAGDGRGGAMLDGERDAIVGVAAEVEVGISPGDFVTPRAGLLVARGEVS